MFRTRAVRKAAVSLVLLAQLMFGFGGAGGLVVCFAAGGHLAVEEQHGASSAERPATGGAVAQSPTTSDRISARESPSIKDGHLEACMDVPLQAYVASQDYVDSPADAQVKPTVHGFVPTGTLQGDPTLARGVLPPERGPPVDPAIRLLRTVVLLI